MMKKDNKKSSKTNTKTKNNNAILFQLLPNQYEIDLYLCLTKVPVPSIIDYLNETLDLGFDENTDIDMESDCPSTFFGLKTPKAVIVLKEWEDPVFTAPILAHEIMHVITYVSSIVSVDIDHLNTSEVWAYFMSFYMAVGMELIKQHIKSEKEEKKKNKKASVKTKNKKPKKISKLELEEAINNPKEKIKKKTRKKKEEKKDQIEQIVEEVQEDKPKKKAKKK